MKSVTLQPLNLMYRYSTPPATATGMTSTDHPFLPSPPALMTVKPGACALALPFTSSLISWCSLSFSPCRTESWGDRGGEMFQTFSSAGWFSSAGVTLSQGIVVRCHELYCVTQHQLVRLVIASFYCFDCLVLFVSFVCFLRKYSSIVREAAMWQVDCLAQP